MVTRNMQLLNYYCELMKQRQVIPLAILNSTFLNTRNVHCSGIVNCFINTQIDSGLVVSIDGLKMSH
jgi:hypothetical protein